MTQNNKTYSGEQLTFYQLIADKNYHIEIPIIQRDYAQGRPSRKEVRNLFLEALFSYLKEGKPFRDLDFIYGTLLTDDETKITRFIPLDGQQRLTTLFLLHQYLAWQSGKTAQWQSIIYHQDKSKFTYQTRISSREFCDILVKQNISPESRLPTDKGKNNSISKTIRNANWYFHSWDNDPTIQAMLVMLDAIDEHFGENPQYFDLLLKKENPIITFQFLNLEEFQLTDDLYLKMNARGKELTPFENFKAKFEQHLATLFDNSPQLDNRSVRDYFAHQIDTTWADIFWKYRDSNNLFDTAMMNFIQAFGLNYQAQKGVASAVQFLRDKSDKVQPVSFKEYTDNGGFDTSFVTDLMSIFNFLSKEKTGIRTYNINSFYYDEKATFKKIIRYKKDTKKEEKLPKLEYTTRLQFYAFCRFLLKNGEAENFDGWMRVVHNLTENTVYNRQDEFINSIKRLQVLSVFSGDILNYLKNDKPVSGFNRTQIEEEKIKAHLILKSAEWKNAILEAEQHHYFKGQIGFLLYYAGITDFYENNGNHCDWNEQENIEFLAKFREYFQKAKAVFGEKGLKEFPEHLFERALLCKGDYLSYSQRNLSFLNNNDRDVGWKRLLFDGGTKREEISRESRRNSLKVLFDDDKFETKNVSNCLQSIIDADLPLIEDWRKDFIALPDLLKYLGQKNYIRFRFNTIYLLTKERLSGRHRELKTFLFWLSHKAHFKNINILPFENCDYYMGVGRDYRPCFYFYDFKYKSKFYELDVYNNRNKEGEFLLEFINSDLKSLNPKLEEKLSKIGFDEKNQLLISQDEFIAKFEVICRELKQLK